MNRGRRKEDIFLCDDDRLSFLDLLAVVHERYGVEVNAYCLMDNHYHLLIHTPEGGLSPALKHVDGVFAQRFNRRHDLDGPVFKDRFRSKLVSSDDYLERVVRYIHRNPLDVTGLERLEDYRWSSYPEFLLGDGRWAPWLSANALRANGVMTIGQLRESTEGPGVRSELDLDAFPEAIGPPSFVRAALLRADFNEQTIGHLRTSAPRPTPMQIRDAVASDASIERVRRLPGGGRSDHLELIELGLCQGLGGLSLRELALRFGYASPQSAGSAAHRFRERLKNEEWALAVEQIRKELEGLIVDDRCSGRLGESET